MVSHLVCHPTDDQLTTLFRGVQSNLEALEVKSEVARVAAVSSGDASDEVTYLRVPYSEKDDAKAQGAQWSPKERKWFVPPGKDLSSFAKWR